MNRGTRAFVLLLLLLLPVTVGCWDKLEVEDQLFPVTAAIDKGERRRYKVIVSMPVPAGSRSGVLGGIGGAKTVEFLEAEADSLAQAMLVLNASMARIITQRHIRGVVVGEELAREGISDLLVELRRNGETYVTAGFWAARGRATDTLRSSRPTAEVVPGKVNEGFLLVEKRLHMAPPIRVQHMIVRQGIIGVDPIAPALGMNRRILGEDVGEDKASALAGDLDRMGQNPLEIAGTAIFRDDRLAGFLTVDETQMLLALRGEMGKAYVTISDPFRPGGHILVRFQQENKPAFHSSITPSGPRVTGHLLFEGEVLSGGGDYRDPQVRGQVEQAARAYMNDLIRTVLDKTIGWQTDPIGFGMRFRSKFSTWDSWAQYDWRRQIAWLQVRVTTDMRIRRVGIIHANPRLSPGG